MAHNTVDTQFVRQKWRLAFDRWENKTVHWVGLAKTKFDPNQPRVPAGNPDGGQWTSGGGSGGGTSNRRQRDPDEGRVLSDATPDNLQKPGARLAQARTPRRGLRPIVINGVPHTPTPGQAARHAVAETRARVKLRQVREIDPKWNPRPGTYETIEGQIAQLRAETGQAEARLRELARQSPTQLIDTYRTLNNSRDMFGRETWPRERDTVSLTRIDRIPFAGVNSTAPTYTQRDRTTAQVAADTLISKHPRVMSQRNIGQKPNDALFHAEATVLLRAARAHRGSLTGRQIEVHTDRRMCDSCEKILPLLGRELGNPTVTFVNPNGVRRTMRDGVWLD